MPKVLTIFATGFEEIEAVTIIDVLRRAGIEVTIAGLDSIQVTGSHNIIMVADCLLKDIWDRKNEFDLLVLPGGLPGATTLRDDPGVIELIQYFHNQKKYTAAICAAPIVLAQAGVLENKNATSYPGQLEQMNLTSTNITANRFETDGKVVTSRGVGTALPFALELVRILVDENKSNELKEKMLVE